MRKEGGLGMEEGGEKEGRVGVIRGAAGIGGSEEMLGCKS